MYHKNTHIHFVGIGGIGMSGIALILKQQGYIVSGCDADLSQPTIAQLENMGCTIHHHNNSPECNNISPDIVVYIPMYEHTIPAISIEIQRARAQGKITVTRAQMLAELMRTKYGIAVTGSHGKTTTSALIAHLLLEAHYDPTLVVGGHLKNINSNAQIGTGDFFVAEADESDRSFLEFNPTLAVITNIDIEHLETYKDLNDIKNTYLLFIKRVPFYGKIIACIDDEHTKAVIQEHNISALTYGIEYPADVYAENIVLATTYSTFSVHQKNNPQQSVLVTLPIPGIHNVYNALAAITVGLEINIDMETIAHCLSSFAGVDRRFSFHGTYKEAEVFDDYGHHPKEIEHILTVAHKRTKNNLIVVFQPHRYTRTQKLWSDFLMALNSSHIGMLIVTDIYSAGEAPIETITSNRLVEELHSINPHLNVHYVPFEDTFEYIKHQIDLYIEPNDLIILLGAGKMHLLAPQLTEKTDPLNLD